MTDPGQSHICVGSTEDARNDRDYLSFEGKLTEQAGLTIFAKPFEENHRCSIHNWTNILC